MSARLQAISTVFLDRDGTINVRPPAGEYVTSPADLVLLPGAARAVADLNAAGLRTILVTNQRWLSGPSGDQARYAAIHARLAELLAAEGAWLDAAYHCPHPPGACGCRKPAPGMLHRAAREFGFDLGAAVMIGDSEADLMAGCAAGTLTILLRAGVGGPTAADGSGRPAAASGSGALTAVSADAVADDLLAAVGLIVAARNAAG